MTITSTTVKTAPLAGNGVTTSWPFAFIAFASTDVGAKIADANGVETTLTNGVDFSVLLNPDQTTSPGGSITYAPALATGSTIVVYSNVPSTQPTAISNQGNQRPLVTERALDRAMVVINQVLEKFSRTPLFPITAGLSNPVLPVPEEGKALMWVNGALENVAPGSTVLSTPADGSVTLDKHAALMPQYAVLARTTAGLGKPEYYATDSGKLIAFATPVSYGSFAQVGTGGGYATIREALDAFMRNGYYHGATFYLEILSNITESSALRFPVGVKVVLYSTVNRTINLAAGVDLVGNQFDGAMVIPDGAWCHFVSTSDTITLDYADGSGASSAPKAAVVVHGTLTTDSTVLSIAASAASLKPDHLIYSVGGRIKTTAAILLSDDATSGYSVDAYGGFVGAAFLESTSANTDVLRVNYANVNLTSTGGTPPYELNGCVGKIVTGTSASGPVLVANYSYLDLDSYSSFTTTATADCNTHLVTVNGGRLVVRGDFDISAAGAGCTRVVNAYNGAEVVAVGCTFTGQGGDYALYGATGATLKGSGNTYTTLTGSNLNSTWAAGGVYFNA